MLGVLGEGFGLEEREASGEGDVGGVGLDAA
jgi:hypothetical protein